MEKGLQIRWTKNILSYKKLIPALKDFPDKSIITFDDDAFYPLNSIEVLYNEHIIYPDTIVTNRARLIISDKGYVHRYNRWNLIVKETALGRKDVFPTGGHGQLYPPGSLHREVFNE